jgi:hypothetical protein
MRFFSFFFRLSISTSHRHDYQPRALYAGRANKGVDYKLENGNEENIHVYQEPSFPGG